MCFSIPGSEALSGIDFSEKFANTSSAATVCGQEPAGGKANYPGILYQVALFSNTFREAVETSLYGASDAAYGFAGNEL